MRNLSEWQRQVLDFIRGYVRDNGVAPSRPEIEGTKQAVLDMKAVLDEAGVSEQDKCSAGGGGTGVLLPRVRSPHPVATISGNLVRD